MENEPILVLDEDADDLVEALLARRPGRYLAARQVAEIGREARDVRICLGAPDRVRDAADGLPALRWIQSSWAGVRPLLGLLDSRGELTVTGAKGIFGELMSEYVFGWILALERRLFDYAGQHRDGLWRPLPQRRLAGRRLAILGLGSIGAHLAAVAQAFGVVVIGISRSGRPVSGVAEVYPVGRLEEAVSEADCLVSVVPDTPATRDLIGARVLRALAPGALLINVGRGSVLVDEELIDALADGHLGGAVLDVFREEPLPSSHPFWTTPNLYLTPHVAAMTLADDIAQLFLENLARWEAGEPLVHRIDPAQGY